MLRHGKSRTGPCGGFAPLKKKKKMMVRLGTGNVETPDTDDTEKKKEAFEELTGPDQNVAWDEQT
jgi:hypothetical protein